MDIPQPFANSPRHGEIAFDDQSHPQDRLRLKLIRLRVNRCPFECDGPDVKRCSDTTQPRAAAKSLWSRPKKVFLLGVRSVAQVDRTSPESRCSPPEQTTTRPISRLLFQLERNAGCPRRRWRLPRPGRGVWVLDFIGSASPRCHLLQPLQRIGILTHQQHQRRRLRIRLGPPLLPLLQRSHMNPQLPRKHLPRTPHPLPSLPDELGIHRRKGPQFHLVPPQRQLATPSFRTEQADAFSSAFAPAKASACGCEKSLFLFLPSRI